MSKTKPLLLTDSPSWAAGLLVPLAPSHAPQTGGSRFRQTHAWLESICPTPPAPLGTLPYGYWVLGDSSEVLFDRNYRPMFVRDLDGTVTRVMDGGRWFKWQTQSYFYDDSNPPGRNRQTRERLIAILARWGIEVPPRDAQPRRRTWPT